MIEFQALLLRSAKSAMTGAILMFFMFFIALISTFVVSADSVLLSLYILWGAVSVWFCGTFFGLSRGLRRAEHELTWVLRYQNIEQSLNELEGRVGNGRE